MVSGFVPLDPDEVIHAPGPWTHRDIAANGARFHIVEAGSGPTVLLLHGFPAFWWTWRDLIVRLAAAGYRAIAMDLRGFGGSDHPPHGYDPITLAADATGVLRSLGVSDATVVGHGWGGIGAWTMAALEPELVPRIVPIGMPHPRALRANLRHFGQWATLGYVLDFQPPLLPERILQHDQASRIEVYLRRWSAKPDWVDDQAQRYRSVFMNWPTAHTSVEPHRWMVRSFWRSDGLRFMADLADPIEADVLHVHGALDPMLLSASCQGSAAYVGGDYTFASMQAGHFPQEEEPELLADLLLDWLDGRIA